MNCFMLVVMTINLMTLINSDDEGDIELLNSSEDPIKSSKLIVFLSSFQCLGKAHISKLRTQGSAVLVNITLPLLKSNMLASLI